MTPVRTPRVRTVLLAACAACCLLVFGGSAHSSPTPFMSGGSQAGSAGAVPSAKAVLHAESELVARTTAAGVAFHLSLTAADLGLAAGLAAFGGWLLLRRRRPRYGAETHLFRPGPARAPPLAA